MANNPADPIYNFEILAIDSKGDTGYQTVKGLMHALLSLENLIHADRTEENEESVKIYDDEGGLTLSIEMLDTSGMVGEPIECGYIIAITAHHLQALDRIRVPLLQQLRNRFRFSNARILTDDVSVHVGTRIYPLITQVETSLRRYLVRFFIQKVGNKWWTLTAPRPYIDKANFRRGKMRGLPDLLTLDVSLIDFDELGELIYKHNSAFNNQEILLEKIRSITSMDDLRLVQREMESNYTRFFKESFADMDFERKWTSLIDLRNKVAHSGFLSSEDLIHCERVAAEVLVIIAKAESHINDFRFSIEEKEAILEKTIKVLKEEAEEEDHASKEEKLNTLGLKVLGKIDLGHRTDDNERIITEKEVLAELDEALEKAKDGSYDYLGLKFFVTKHLSNKGFAVGPSYSIVNILKDKNEVEFYDVTDKQYGYTVKAIRHSGWDPY